MAEEAGIPQRVRLLEEAGTDVWIAVDAPLTCFAPAFILPDEWECIHSRNAGTPRFPAPSFGLLTPHGERCKRVVSGTSKILPLL